MNDTGNTRDLAQLTADLVSAYVGNNSVPPGELGALVARIHGALSGLVAAGGADAASAGSLRPAVPIDASIAADHLVCLEDGKTFKSLKRHLRARYGLSPAQYRAKWGLPPDYPMVAPSYAKARSDLAKAIGLGQVRPGRYEVAA